MLALDEFTIGSLADAVPLSLMLPRSIYDFTVLIGGTAEAPVAVCLDQRAAYSLIAQNDGHACSGLIVPGVRIEIDPKQVVSHQDRRAGGVT